MDKEMDNPSFKQELEKRINVKKSEPLSYPGWGKSYSITLVENAVRKDYYNENKEYLDIENKLGSLRNEIDELNRQINELNIETKQVELKRKLKENKEECYKLY